MAVANERQKTGRSAASGRSSNKRQRPAQSARRPNGAAPRKPPASTRGSASTRKSQSAAAGKRSSTRAAQPQRPTAVAQRNGTLMTAGLSALSATVGVAGGVLLGRTALQRHRKVLGVPVPSKIEFGDVGQQIAEAGRQFGKLAGEVRAVRRKAEQIGRVLS